MRRLLPLIFIPWLLAASGHWALYTSGPFVVLTDAGAHAGQGTLLRFEEFRHALGQIIGEPDLETPVPIRVLVFKDARGWISSTSLAEGRDCYAIALAANAPIPSAVYTGLTRLFLESNTKRMPAHFEHGLIELFSTFQITGIHITVGEPPPNPDLDWARVHLLASDPQYYGRLRVLLYNLRQGVDQSAAYQNAFGKSPAEIEAQAKTHLAAGNFQLAVISSRPLTERDFREKAVSDSDVRLSRADLLAGAQSAAEYKALIHDQVKVAESWEGLGLLALRDHNQSEAHRDFSAAIDAGSKSARCYIEYAKLEPDHAKATQALLRAAGINSKLDEPFALLAQHETDPQKRLMYWKDAAQRNPRNAAYWKALAEGYLAEHNFTEAAKAWTAGEQAASDPAERERMHQARMAIEKQRLDYEDTARKQQADADARELDTLKQEARAHVHQLESEYSDSKPVNEDKVVPWWSGSKAPAHVTGSLSKVDCLRTGTRLVIAGDDHKTIRLLIPDPSKIVMTGTGDMSLGCGVQQPRRVSIQYFPKSNPKLATTGEVATIEFQ
ncbi:MAG TPA: hypothetical protein VG675_02665 [Bryobacteraceae bacterium]|nr:hypothetical protein [Bryobacteraceae bacterium]